MTGSLQTKNDKFYIVLNTTENGKRKQKWIATGLPVKGNKRKAEQLLRDTLHEYELTSETAKSDILFADYIRLWLKTAQRRVEAVTYHGYEQAANSQVIPYFEERNIKLCDITLETLQAYFDEKAAHGRMKGAGGVSPTTLRQFKNVIHQTLNEAVKNRLIPSNPCQFVELPHKHRYESTFYSAEQLKALFHAIEGDELYPLIKITALYGLRRSEALGLKWDSIDFAANRLTIKHTVERITGTTIEKDRTKNKSSHRSFPLTPEARAIFEDAKKAEQENRQLCGKDYIENDYVFKWVNGRPFTPDYVTSHFALLLKKNGLPHIRYHELRHSCASLLLNNGCTLKDVQEYMGHSDIQMTANIYGHLDTTRKQALTDNISASLFGGC
ncbi:MAG: site-specific integrase [Ruminococcaceae bacterium]|nr:site-specific integrase [Oscillospiraceae bacterium]